MQCRLQQREIWLCHHAWRGYLGRYKAQNGAASGLNNADVKIRHHMQGACRTEYAQCSLQRRCWRKYVKAFPQLYCLEVRSMDLTVPHRRRQILLVQPG